MCLFTPSYILNLTRRFPWPERWCTWWLWAVGYGNARPLWRYSGPICWCPPGPIREQTVSISANHTIFKPLWGTLSPSLAYLRQQLLLVCLDPKTIAGAPRDAGRVADLPHPTDLSHHSTLLLLLLLLALPPFPFPWLGNRTRKLQLILLVWIKKTQK